MPREDRRILFTYDEAYKAIYGLSVQKNIKKPPPAQLTNIEKHPSDDTIVIVTLENKQENWDAPKTSEYSMDFMAAALMLFCRGCGIPLPKSAKKSVMMIPGGIILRVEI
jgi:hypothetical protein